MSKLIQRIINWKYFEYILLSLILILGFLVRLYKINNPIADWHSWRQADTASVARIYLERGIDFLHPRYYDISSIQSGIFNPEGYRFVEFPLYNAVHALITMAYPRISLEVWGRLISIFSALVSAVFLYLIGKEYLGKWGGLLSAFFFLFIPFNIYFTRVILPEPFGVTLAIIGVFLFDRFISREKDIYLYLSGLFLSLSILIKPFFGFYLTPLAYLAIKKFNLKQILTDPKLLIKLLIFANIIFIPFFIWRVWENNFPQGIPFFTWAFNGDGIRFRPSFWRWIFSERLGHLILGSLGLIPFFFGILNTKIKNLFIQFFLLGMLAYVVIVATANVRHDYYQIIAIPAIALSLASGFIYMWNNLDFHKWLSRIIAVFCVGVMLITGWILIREDYMVNHPEIIEAGHEVDKIVPKNAIVIAPYNGDTAFLYQTKRFGWPAIDDSIDNIIKKGASYYVSVDLGSADTKMVIERFTTVEKTDKFIIANLTKPLKK
jgi:hypothetical protein